MKSESLVKTTESKFEMDQQFEELTADGRKVLTTMKVVISSLCSYWSSSYITAL